MIEPMRNRRAASALAPRFGSETDDLRLIFDYLGIPPTSGEAQHITGLGKSTISEILAGKQVRESRWRLHIALGAELVRDLQDARRASTGSASRGAPARGWLHAERVFTSRGTRSPVEVMVDTDLVREQLGPLV